MHDSRIIKLAETLVNYCVEVQPDDNVLLRGSVPGLPLIKETYRQIIRSGGHPLLLLEDDTFAEIFLSEASEEQIQYIPQPTSSPSNTVWRINKMVASFYQNQGKGRKRCQRRYTK